MESGRTRAGRDVVLEVPAIPSHSDCGRHSGCACNLKSEPEAVAC